MRKVLWILFILFFIGLLLSFHANISIILSGARVYQGRFAANDILDTIGYGQMALSFIIITFCLFLEYRTIWRWFLFIPIIWGLFSMGMANSRSPFVSLLSIIAIVIIRRINIKIILFVLTFFLLFIINIDYIDHIFQEYFKSTFISRFLTIFEFSLANSSGRDEFFREGLILWRRYPLFGRSILLIDKLAGGYVHNIFIEVLMSLGLIGGIIFLGINIKMLMYLNYLLKINSKYLFFAYIFIQYFVFLQFSRSLMLLPIYWASMACVFSCYLVERNEKSSNYNS